MVAKDRNLSPLIEAHQAGLFREAIARVRTASRQRRGALFGSLFDLGPTTRILDLGGWNGAHIHSLLAGKPVLPVNVHIADIDRAAVQSAAARFGYSAAVIAESGSIPYPDGFFDVVFCSSVLEHVTVPKEDVWREKSGKRFRYLARARQRGFAAEIARVGKGYFVQVPYRWFPVETHTWLPFAGYLPRALLCPLIRGSNRFWMKKASPDFYMPSVREMTEYFPGAEILRERFWGMTKSLIAVKRKSESKALVKQQS